MEYQVPSSLLLIRKVSLQKVDNISELMVHIGKYVYKKTAGYKSLAEYALPMDFDSTYAIVSCTKLITSIAALQCVERGQITLDGPVDKLLP